MTTPNPPIFSKKEGIMEITESQFPKFKKILLKDYIKKAEVEKVLNEFFKEFYGRYIAEASKRELKKKLGLGI